MLHASMPRLGGHADDQLAEVASLQDSDENAWRVFETVDDVLAVANATSGDARTNPSVACQSRPQGGPARPLALGEERFSVAATTATAGTLANRAANEPIPG